MVLCANQCCSHRAGGSAGGVAALCERCSPGLGGLGRDKAALRALYMRQLSVGCGRQALCKNPCCGLVGGGEGEGAFGALLDHLCSITSFYVCVSDRARLAVPPLPPQLARARRASVGAGAGAGAGAAGGAGAGGARQSKKSVARAFF